MGNLLLLVLLGGLAYFTVRRSTAGITRTPVWALWLAIMLPAFVWVAWLSVAEDNAKIPWWLMIGPFVLSSFLYLWLLQRGRRDTPAEDTATAAAAAEQPTPPQPVRPEPAPRPLSADEEATLRNCFSWNTYYLQQVDYGLQTIACVGKLRTEPQTAYQRIRENIEAQFGKRFLVVFQERPRGDAYFMLYPNPYQQLTGSEINPRQPGLALLLLAITFFTTIQAGAQFAGTPVADLQSDPTLLRQGLPYALGILWVLSVHGLSYFFAAVYHRIHVSLPLLIPIPFFLGVLGVFSQRRSPVPNRRALFDTALAGPLAGFLVALPVLIGGLLVSEIVPLDTVTGTDPKIPAGLFNLEVFDPRSSLLLVTLCKLALGSQFTPEAAIKLSPLAIAGYFGIAIATIRLIPIGRLDGGHIVHAMYGRYAAGIIGNVTRALILILVYFERGFLIWAIAMLFLPTLDEPALDDVTELNGWRDALGLFALALLISVLVPAPVPLLNLMSV